MFQSVFQRQQIVRKQFELKQQKDAEAIAKRQQLQELLNATGRSERTSHPSTSASRPTLTPLISPSVVACHAQRTIGKPISAVSNLLAIQKAKAKIEELKAAKLRQQQITIAHTATKGAPRVAHINKVAEATVSIGFILK